MAAVEVAEALLVRALVALVVVVRALAAPLQQGL